MTDIPNPASHAGRSFSLDNIVHGADPRESVFAVRPPPEPTPGRPGTTQRRVTGLRPAQAGSSFALVLRGPTKAKIDPRDVSRLRADKRIAERAAQKAQGALLDAAGPGLSKQGSPAYLEALAAAQGANDLVAALVSRLAEMEAASTSRPIRVHTAKVREPAEVADVIGSDGVYVCLHDACRGQRWGDEASMRRGHPTDAELLRLQQCHAFAILCEAPLDPLDPEGEIVGLVAIVGRDGTTIAQVRGAAEEVDDRADELHTLRTANAGLEERLARMESMFAELTGTPKAAAATVGGTEATKKAPTKG